MPLLFRMPFEVWLSPPETELRLLVCLGYSKQYLQNRRKNPSGCFFFFRNSEETKLASFQWWYTFFFSPFGFRCLERDGIESQVFVGEGSIDIAKIIFFLYFNSCFWSRMFYLPCVHSNFLIFHDFHACKLSRPGINDPIHKNTGRTTQLLCSLGARLSSARALLAIFPNTGSEEYGHVPWCMYYVFFHGRYYKFVRNLFLNISWKIISMTTYILLKI